MASAANADADMTVEASAIAMMCFIVFSIGDPIGGVDRANFMAPLWPKI
jgi:hypothetical protein